MGAAASEVVAGPRGGAVRSDALVVAAASGSLMLVSAIAAAVQTAWVQDVLGHPGQIPTLTRLATNLVEAVAAAGTLVVLGVHRRERPAARVGLVVLAALIASAVRFGAQQAFGIESHGSGDARLLQLGAGVPMALVAGGLALVALAAQRRVRTEAARAARDAEARRGALRALEDEEVRVRREIAEGLHGTAQQRLVLVVAGLDQLAAMVTGDPVAADLLRDLREKVETVRAGDVRHASRLLYPHQVEVGLVPAVRSLLAEVPASVATALTVDPAVSAVDEVGASRFSRGERLLVARVVEEALSNALRHGGAVSVAVDVTLVDGDVVVSIRDDGCGFAATGADGCVTQSGGGLSRLAERMRLVGGTLTAQAAPGGGALVRARMPVELARPAVEAR